MPVIECISSSLASHTTMPDGCITESAVCLSCSDRPSAAYIPLTPMPICEGVFGITRTMRRVPSSMRLKVSTFNPAATDSTSAPLVAMFSHAVFMSCGLTANTNTSCSVNAGSVAEVFTPYKAASFSRFSAPRFTTCTLFCLPARCSPAMMAAAILPPPKK